MKNFSLLSALCFFISISQHANAQINIKVKVSFIKVLSSVDCDGFLDGDSDFLFEYKAQDNSPLLNSNNSPVAGSIGACNYAVVNGNNGPYTSSPSAPISGSVFSPTNGIFFDRIYNCKQDVPSLLTITWRAYENDDPIAPSTIPTADGIIAIQTNSYAVPAANGTYTLQYTAASTSGSCIQSYQIGFEIEKSIGTYSYITLGLPETSTICSGASNGFVEVDAFGGSGTILYDWSTDGVGDFDDNVMQTGLTAGTYTLVVKDALNCTDTSIVTVVSVNAPVNISSFTTSTPSVCTNQTGVIYTVPTQTNSVFYWNFSGPGAVMNGTGNSITMDFLSFANNGTLSVYAQNSCSVSPTLTLDITVQQSPSIIITGNNTVCENTQDVLTASGANTYSWSTTANTPSTTISPTATTVYTVVGTSTAGCIAVQQYTVNSIPSPTLQVVGSTVAVCPNQTVAVNAIGNGNVFFWSDGYIGNNHQVKALTTTVFTVTTTYTNSCYTQSTFTLNVNPGPVLSVIGNTIVCDGGTVSLTANGANSYAWSDGVTTNTNTFVPLTSLNLTLVGTALNGCKDSLVKSISVVASPTVFITGNDTICEGKVENLTATSNGIVTYGWNSGDNTSSIFVSPITTFTYVVIADNGGCTGSASHEVFVKPLPVIDFTIANPILCTNNPAITFTANPAGGIYSGTGVVMNDMFDPSIGVGTYTVYYSVTGSNGCFASQTQTIDVMICTDVSNATIEKDLNLFPNPTSSYVTLKSSKEIATVLVYDYAGKLVQIVEVNTSETILQTESLAKGFYTLSVTMKDNSQSVLKLIKD